MGRRLGQRPLGGGCYQPKRRGLGRRRRKEGRGWKRGLLDAIMQYLAMTQYRDATPVVNTRRERADLTRTFCAL